MLCLKQYHSVVKWALEDHRTVLKHDEYVLVSPQQEGAILYIEGRLYEGVLYFGGIILLYGTRLNVISFSSISKYGFPQSPSSRNSQILKSVLSRLLFSGETSPL
jgi:hypothetical protein